MKDKFFACTSDLGLINGGKSWKNGCILPGCKLDESKLIDILITGTADGANCHRELYSWSVALSDVEANPFEYDYDLNKFDLPKFNESYFKMLKRFGKLVNKYRGMFIFDPYDECGIKNKSGKPKRTPFNPWTNNKQGIKGWFDPKAKDYCKAWEDKLNETLKGIKWIPTIGNELTKRCIDQGKRTLTNFLDKGHKVVYHGMLHNTTKNSHWWWWHKWQKKNWWLDEHVGEVWHLKGTIAKIKKMGNDHKEIPVEPHCMFSIDGLMANEMNIQDVVDIIAPLNKVKDSGKFTMFFKKKPVFEVLNYNNKHITLALNKIHNMFFGKNLENFGKTFDIPKIPEPIDVPEPEDEPTKPIITYDPDINKGKEVKKMTFKSIISFIWKWIKSFFVNLFKAYRFLYLCVGILIGWVLF